MSSLFSFGLAAASGPSMEGAAQEASVLFVGNSLTFWNKGIFKHIAPLGPFACDSETIGGATLRVHMKAGGAMKAIAAGHFGKAFDFVVLQDDLPEYASQDEARAEFHSLGEQFVAAARAAGATPVMYMAWPYARLPRMPLELIVELHRGLAKKTGVAVAPVGIAFGLATERAASIGQPADYLLDHDKEHPSAAGTFLATIVIFRAITGHDAGLDVGLTQRPLKGKVAPKVEATLRQVAKEAAAAWEAGS
jgi:hypothetical protein